MTGCDVAQRLASDALDDPLETDQREILDEHLRDCPACRRFVDDLSSLRRQLRVSSVGRVPDIAGAVRARLEDGDVRASRSGRRWRPHLARAAAVLLVGGVLGALVAGVLGSPVVLADTIGERMLRSQAAIGSLSARVTITEHGWHPEVDTRRFEGRLVYASPDRLALTVDDRTSYPDGRWRPNDVTVAIGPDRILRRGPAPCPVAALPTCTPPQPRTEVVDDPEPFSVPNLAPLDLIVPTGSFGPDEPVTTIDDHPVDGRATVAVEVTAAQVDGLLTTLLGTGNWRRVHPTDRVRLWLDEEWLVPLEVEVLAGSGLERGRWASVHGYEDEPGERILRVITSDLAVNGGVRVTAPELEGDPDQRTDGGFRSFAPDAVEVPKPGWLPSGMEPHAAGIVGEGIHVRTWTDGRAWLKIRATSTWDAQRLFGRVGPVVRRSEADGSVLYTSADGATVGLHGDRADVAVTGSLSAEDLQRVAASLPIQGQAVPADWQEAATLRLDEAARIVPDLLVPPDDPGFHAPAARRVAKGVSLTVAGSGARGYELLQLPGDVLTPPTGADVLVVAVRGTSARYTAGTGELEWTEDGRVTVLRSDTLPLAELIAIADSLRTHP
ncbi:MAG: zf-HC2 domain-containing protein [Actinobacteria bacterium]|nr:zf-HC2 domain-containing protein [Actinomycetota bacterium]